MNENKKRAVVIGLSVLGIAMIAIGAVAMMLPPALTGLGFLLLAWGFTGRVG